MIQKKLGDNEIFSNILYSIAQMDYRILVQGDLLQPRNLDQFQRRRRIDFGIDILSDDWFLIHLNYGDDYILFKCDQFEGLEKFVEDLPTIVFYYPLSVPTFLFR
jgi:hypothetical protein